VPVNGVVPRDFADAMVIATCWKQPLLIPNAQANLAKIPNELSDEQVVMPALF